ncbi:hypothetical protein LJC34_07970, partial [Oscillospiraceae bacterium OttesenSCG-928-G22]|nr:hypothetical protein [Oscillospiraceae bacterium OttesenSCG-928-G22]
IATTTLTSRAIGKRDGKLFRSYYSEIVKIALVVGVVATATLCLIPVPFMKLLTDKAVLQQIGAGYVFIMGFAQVPQVMTKVLNGVIRSTGGTRVPMYFSIIGLWVVRIPLILLVGSYLHLHINFIWALIAMDMTSRMIMGLIYTKKKDVTHYVEREFPGEAAEKQADA